MMTTMSQYAQCQSSCSSKSFNQMQCELSSNLSSYIRSLFDYGAPATCVASPHVQRIWEGVQTHFITRALSIPCYIHNDRKRQHAYLPPIHDRNLYLAKRWYRRAMLHNSGVQDYVDNHTHNDRTRAGSRNTPLELIRN